jgi:hypothetical protein
VTQIDSSAAAREAALGTGMTRGMEQSYQRLDEIFAATPVSRGVQSAA